jgi:2'-5' RNA ligase
MRLFVALSIPAEVRENLSSLIGKLQPADSRPRWVNPRNLHITLKFIGEVSSDSVREIGAALATVHAAQHVKLGFRGIGFFPNSRRPSVAWVGIESSPNLAQLASDVNLALSPLGIPREEKPFVPHLTIVRFAETRLSLALKAEIEKFEGSSFGTLAATEFHLVESQRKSTGAEYTTLRSFQFAPEEAQGNAP